MRLMFLIAILGFVSIIACNDTTQSVEKTVSDKEFKLKKIESGEALNQIDKLVLASFWENDLDLLMNQKNLWDKLLDNGIQSIVLPLSFIEKHPKEEMFSFLEKAKSKSILCFISWQGENIKADPVAFLEKFPGLTKEFPVRGVLFEKIEGINSALWIELASKTRHKSDLLLLAYGQVHPSSINTFFDGTVNPAIYDLFNLSLETNNIRAKEFREGINLFKEKMPSKAIPIYDTRSAFWGSWEKYPSDDLKTVLSFTLGGIVKLNIESGGLGLSDISELYEDLIRLKNVNPALGNGVGLQWLSTDNHYIIAFAKKKGTAKVIVFANTSSKVQKMSFNPKGLEGAYSNIFDQSSINIQERLTIELEPMEYILLSNRF